MRRRDDKKVMIYYIDMNQGLFYHSATETFHDLNINKTIRINLREVLESNSRTINE